MIGKIGHTFYDYEVRGSLPTAHLGLVFMHPSYIEGEVLVPAESVEIISYDSNEIDRLAKELTAAAKLLRGQRGGLRK